MSTPQLIQQCCARADGSMYGYPGCACPNFDSIGDFIFYNPEKTPPDGDEELIELVESSYSDLTAAFAGVESTPGTYNGEWISAQVGFVAHNLISGLNYKYTITYDRRTVDSTYTTLGPWIASPADTYVNTFTAAGPDQVLEGTGGPSYIDVTPTLALPSAAGYQYRINAVVIEMI